VPFTKHAYTGRDRVSGAAAGQLSWLTKI